MTLWNGGFAMNIKSISRAIILPIFFITLISCGTETVDDSIISGRISLADEYKASIKGPVFIAVSKTDDIELIEKDPASHIAAIYEADLGKGTFCIDLKDSGIVFGDDVLLFAFVDNDYRGGIPNPTKGDIVGFYIDRNSFSTKYRVGSDSLPEIIINRYNYGHKTKVEGIIDSEEAGDVILIAYAGELDLTDFFDTGVSGIEIDVDSIIGYKKFTKPAQSVFFSLSIMPYGFETPNDAYIFAVLDENGNGKPDTGEKIGFYGIGVELDKLIEYLESDDFSGFSDFPELGELPWPDDWPDDWPDAWPDDSIDTDVLIAFLKEINKQVPLAIPLKISIEEGDTVLGKSIIFSDATY